MTAQFLALPARRGIFCEDLTLAECRSKLAENLRYYRRHGYRIVKYDDDIYCIYKPDSETLVEVLGMREGDS